MSATLQSNALRSSAKPQTKVAAGSISSLRVRPFTCATRGVLSSSRAQQQLVVARAAEPEAQVVEEAFEFNLSDAKKGNDFNASDVEAALRFYEGEGEAPGDVNGEFVENQFGIEDAAFFDDMDNNEAYDDEFIAAGIPEAAPKARQGRRGGEGEGEDADKDDIAAAKEADRLKQIEEDMVLASQMEEMGLDKQQESAVEAVGPATWDWLADAENDDEDLEAVASSGVKSVAANVMAMLPADEEIFADLRGASLQDVDVETRETVEFLLDDFDIESEVKVIPDNLEESFEAPAFSPLAEADVARIEALLKEDLSLPDLDLSELEVPEIVDDGLSMSEEAVTKYVASLQNISGKEVSAEQLKEIFGDEPMTLVDVSSEPAVTMDDVDLTEPQFTALSAADLEVQALEDDLMEQAEVDEYRAELLALRAMPDVSVEVPPEEEVDVLDQYLSAAEQFIEGEAARKAQLAQQVIKGELSPDALEEEDDFVDAETELLMPDDMEDLAELDDDFEDGENWQERIVELTRVTKVVKGGKLMGFRCTAIVGNGNGLVGVGCQAGREIATAVKRALVDAKKSVVMVPLVGAGTVPHRVEAKFNAARCVILPAADGTGVLAGGAIRSVLELAGVQNVLAKRIGCRSLLNNARCTVKALTQLRTLQEVAKARGVPMERLLLPTRN